MFLSKFFKNPNLDFVKTHKIAFVLSAILIVFSIFSIFTKGFNFGIDFSGGVLIEAETKTEFNVAQIRTVLSKENFKSLNIQEIDEDALMIRVSPQNQDEDQTKTATKIKEILNDEFPEQFEYRKTDFVGPQVGAELIKKGAMALVISFVMMMFYIWIRFDWQFGLGGVLALIHDAILTLGLFSFIQLEFDLTSVAAILTIIGYSINDSVVIYDRIREYSRKYKKKEIAQILNLSINSTLSRTVLTGGSTLVALLALVLIGGEVLRSFSVAVLFGVVIGTYSSIYISAPILLYMNISRNGEKKVNTKKVDK